MPTPDYYDLYNLWDQVEGAAAVRLKLRLSQAGMNKVQVVTSRDAPVKSTPRIELSFSLQNTLAQRTTASAGPARKIVPNAFEAALSAVIYTTRPIATENAPDHGRIVGLTMFHFTGAAQPFNDENLPLLEVLEMLVDAGSPRVIDAKSQDATGLNWHMWLAIRNGSWETCTPPAQ